jgi:hypothetical protein
MSEAVIDSCIRLFVRAQALEPIPHVGRVAGHVADQVRAGDQQQAARALGIEFPLSILIRADETIE